jgi:omega-amidase
MTNSMADLRVTLVQTSLYWESIDENLARFQALLSGADDTDLIVLPEMFSTGFSMDSQGLAEDQNGSAVKWMAHCAREHDAHVCGSVMIRENAQYLNRFVWLSPDGQIQTYDKKHLFRMSTENDHFSPGGARLIVELGGFRICPMVCYDLRFPVWSRNLADNPYDLLLFVANWPAARNQHWKTLLSARAIENLSYCIGVNRIGTDGNGVHYSGDSQVIDFRGELISDLGSEERLVTVELSLAAVQQYRASFPAYLDADAFQLL